MPEPVRPGAIGSHETRIFLSLLCLHLAGAQVAAIVPRCGLLGEPGAVGRWVELLGLLQDDGLRASLAGGRISHEYTTRYIRVRNSEPSPDLRRLRQQESRNRRRRHDDENKYNSFSGCLGVFTCLDSITSC